MTMRHLLGTTAALLLLAGTARAAEPAQSPSSQKPAAPAAQNAAAPAAPNAAAAGGDAANAQDPNALIEDCAQRMLRELDAHRAEYQKSPEKVNKLVDEVLLPHFDTEYAARLVLGKHWRTATAEQRERFVKAFYQSLLDNYGSALVNFTADRMQVLPFHGEPGSDRAIVRTEVKRSDGTRVPVNYAMHKTDQGWKAWDVTIEGISYVKNFRNDFGAEIDQNGIDAVIKRLEAGGAPTKKTA